MGSVLLVGMGGALGAVGRYGLSLLPWRGDFPLLTLLTNLLGAVLIGFVAGMAGRGRLPSGWTLFWKTGVCGGFTTFSTFSSDVVRMLKSGDYTAAGLCVALNFAVCVCCILLGTALGRLLKR